MLVTSTHLGIAQPRTGSTTRRLGFAPLAGGSHKLRGIDRDYEGHIPLRDIPPEVVGDRTVVATVRDPYSWLVSVYLRVRTANPQKRADVLRWGGGKTDWESVLYGFTHPWELPHDPMEHTVHNPGAPTPEQWAEFRGGLWSWSTRWFYEGSHLWVDCDQQNLAWSKILSKAVDPEAILNCTSLNVGPIPASVGPQWWNPERIGWVKEADGDLMALLGYTGPGTKAKDFMKKLEIEPKIP